jgi:parvulin-like peptidyl-prolyl isomerase
LKRSLGAVCVAVAIVGGGCAGSGPAATPASPASRAPSAQAGRAIAASAAPNAPASGSDVVARVGTQAITKDEILGPMLEAHGVNFLLHLVQLEIAKQLAAQQGVTVTPDELKAERAQMFKRMLQQSTDELEKKLDEARQLGDNAAVERIQAELNADPEPLLDQFLAQRYVQSRQYISRAEFDIGLETTAYLRKIAQASPDVEKAITEEALRKMFAVEYGEKVVIRHIQSNDMLGIQEARRRLQAGEDFAEVAQAVSVNTNTRPLGGAVRPFTMNDTSVPQLLKETAFGLTVGQVSEAVHADNAFHILKLENRIAPKAVKYEDVRASLRDVLKERFVLMKVGQLREVITQQTTANLQIEHPALKQLYDRWMSQRQVQREQMDQSMKRARPAPPQNGQAPAASAAATQPAPAAGEGTGDAPAAAPAPAPADTATPEPADAAPTEAGPGGAAPAEAAPAEAAPANVAPVVAPADAESAEPADNK